MRAWELLLVDSSALSLQNQIMHGPIELTNIVVEVGLVMQFSNL
jgi:hypothetical protein